MKQSDPAKFAEAVKIDARLREREYEISTRIVGKAFLHRRLLPLEEAVALDEIELARRESLPKQVAMDGFMDECGGYCGV